jgi:hypothetical protein
MGESSNVDALKKQFRHRHLHKRLNWLDRSYLARSMLATLNAEFSISAEDCPSGQAFSIPKVRDQMGSKPIHNLDPD